MDVGRRILGRAHVMDGVADMIVEVQVEGTFPDGTKLVTVHRPIALDRVDLALALHGSFLPVPPDANFPDPGPPAAPPPGEVLVAARLDRAQRRARRHRARGQERRRPAHPGRQPLSVRRDEHGARLRSRPGHGQAPRHPRGDRGALRAGRREDGAPRRDGGDATPTGGRVMTAIDRRHYADMFGPTDGRSRAPGRHGARRRGRARLRGVRRRVQVRRRQGPARSPGPARGRQRSRRARLRHHERRS